MTLESLVHRRTSWSHVRWLFVFPFMLMLIGCGSPSATGSQGCPAVSGLRGAGSTFDAPLFNKLFAVYPHQQCGLSVYYYAAGSSAGSSQLLSQMIDFGATDAPLTDQQLSTSRQGAILHVPVTLGAVAVSYRLSGVTSPLHLAGELLANIYLGKVTYWDDVAIRNLNAGMALPHRAIQVLHRSDGSGTTAIFTHYLASVSSDWQKSVGASTQVEWPVGRGVQGSFGIIDTINETEGSLGYAEASYAANLHLPVASLFNASGTLVTPSIASVQAAAASFQVIPADLRFYTVNAKSPAAYPIVGYSWVIIYRDQQDVERGMALASLLWWMIHDGQQYAEPLQYAPLPADIVARGEAQITSMTCGSSRAACLSK